MVQGLNSFNERGGGTARAKRYTACHASAEDRRCEEECAFPCGEWRKSSWKKRKRARVPQSCDMILNERILRLVVVLAEELHFGRASERLHVSQPALSGTLKLLESDLGVRLFKCSSRKVELMEAGRVLASEAQRLIKENEQAVDFKLDAAQGSLSRFFRLSARECVAEHWKAADRFGFGRLVLQDVPMLFQQTVFESDNVGGDPRGGPSIPTEAAVSYDIVTFCDYELILIAQSFGR